MIKHNQDFGVSKNITVVEFGKGDISVSFEYSKDDSRLCFANLEQPRKLGEEITERKGIPSIDLQQDLVFYFPTDESLDNFLQGLVQLRIKRFSFLFSNR